MSLFSFAFFRINLPQMSNVTLESNNETANRSWSSTSQSGSATGQSESITGQSGSVTDQSGSGAGHFRSLEPFEPGHEDIRRMQSCLVANADGSSPSTVLQFAPEYERHVVRNAGNLPILSHLHWFSDFTPLSTVSVTSLH